MAFILGKHLVFFDSFQFMASSLDNFAMNLPSEKFKYTSQVFRDKLELLKKKGIYPYDFMDIFDKFDLDKLPTKDELCGMLTAISTCPECLEHIKAQEYGRLP